MPSCSLARQLPVLTGLLVSSASLASAACECGYTARVPTGPNQGQTALFTDLLETDFLHEEDLSVNTDWAPQEWTIDKKNARGEYGETFSLSNVATNPIPNEEKYSGSGTDSGDLGLTLTVRAEIEDDKVPVAEISSTRQDMIYGTYRAGIMLTDVNGTCGAFFWYFNDTQEIDMEFLSKEFDYDNDIYPVNLVLQSRESLAQGYDASGTRNFIKANLSFNPTTAFHEYRMDFYQNYVVFLADGEELATMNGSAVPFSPGHLLLSHWSNGNPLWSGGPPETDAVLAVSYVKAYFNSTEEQRQRDWQNRCKDINAENATCAIPEVTPNNNDAATFFFSQQENMTVNQTVSGQESVASGSHRLGTVVLAMALFLSGCIVSIW